MNDVIPALARENTYQTNDTASQLEAVVNLLVDKKIVTDQEVQDTQDNITKDIANETVILEGSTQGQLGPTSDPELVP